MAYLNKSEKGTFESISSSHKNKKLWFAVLFWLGMIFAGVVKYSRQILVGHEIFLKIFDGPRKMFLCASDKTYFANGVSVNFLFWMPVLFFSLSLFYLTTSSLCNFNLSPSSLLIKFIITYHYLSTYQLHHYFLFRALNLLTDSLLFPSF